MVQVLEKNRRIAYKNGWRRLWDGRSGALYDKWKRARLAQDLAVVQTEQLRGEDDLDVDRSDSDEKKSPVVNRGTGGQKRISAYDVVNAYADPRTAPFPCDADTVSEDEIDRLERENFEVSSEEEYVGDEDDGAAAGEAGDDGDGSVEGGGDEGY